MEIGERATLLSTISTLRYGLSDSIANLLIYNNLQSRSVSLQFKFLTKMTSSNVSKDTLVEVFNNLFTSNKSETDFIIESAENENGNKSSMKVHTSVLTMR